MKLQVLAVLIPILETEEGYREEPYYCSERFPTVGFGFKIGVKNAPLPVFRLPRVAGEAWLKDETEKLWSRLADRLAHVNNARAAVLLSMAYQLGVSGCLGFRNMWAAVARDDWPEVARQALDSKWARQTPNRAKRHAYVLEHGSTVGVYV